MISSGDCIATDKNINFLVTAIAKRLLFFTVLLAKLRNTICTLILSVPYVGVHSSPHCSEFTEMQGQVRKTPEWWMLLSTTDLHWRIGKDKKEMIHRKIGGGVGGEAINSVKYFYITTNFFFPLNLLKSPSSSRTIGFRSFQESNTTDYHYSIHKSFIIPVFIQSFQFN